MKNTDCIAMKFAHGSCNYIFSKVYWFGGRKKKIGVFTPQNNFSKATGNERPG